MPAIGPRCHELRIKDSNRDWRILYMVDDDAIVILDVFEKRSPKTPKNVIAGAKTRLRKYEEDSGE
jgi:phage-related protein